MKVKSYGWLVYLAICFFVLFAAFAEGEAAGATYYVSPTGSDSSNGSAGAPFKTIQKAANIVNPGDTVIVKDGVYSDTDNDGRIVNITRGGTSSAWITFSAENRLGAVLDGNNNATDWCFLLGLNAKYLTIEGFDIRGCGQGGIMGNAGAHNINIFDNDIHDIAGYCGSDPTGNPNGHGIASGGQTYDVYDWSVIGNKIHDIGRPQGCPGNDGSTYYASEYGVYLNGYNNTIADNVFYNNFAGWNIHLGRSCITESDGNNMVISNNTFGNSDDKVNGTIMLYVRGECGTLQFSNVVINNNTAYDSNMSLVGTYNATKGFTINNNLIYSSRGEALVTSNVSPITYTSSNNIIRSRPLIR